MNQILEEYYSQVSAHPLLLKQKYDKLQKHADICAEFEHWITNQEYTKEGIIVEGYSAESLSKLSPFLDGEGAFMLLIELRENPMRAIARIQEGFKIK